MKITVERLRELDACEDQMEIFEKEWPEGMEVTKKNCLRAAEIGLDIEWAAESLLSPDAWAEYRAKEAPLLAEFEAKKTPLLAEYKAKEAPLLAEYEAKKALAFWQAAK